MTINLWLAALVVFIFCLLAKTVAWFPVADIWLIISGLTFCIIGALAAVGVISGSVTFHS